MDVHIPRSVQMALWTALVLAVLVGIGFWVYKVEVRDEKRRLVALQARAKAETLVDVAAKLKKAAEAFQSKQAADGMPLAPGKIISLGDLEESRILSRSELETRVRIDQFSYLVLPEEAPGQTVQMVLITDKGRATMKKSGEGALYEK